MTTTWVSTTEQKGINGTGDTKANSASETHPYLVQFSNGSASAYDARNATGLPAYGAQLEGIGGPVQMWVTAKTANQTDKDPAVWTVDVVYSTIDPTTQMPPAPDDFSSGDKFGVEVQMRGIPYAEEIQVDKDNKVICNTNNEPINPRLTATKYDRALHVSFYSDKVPQTTIDACIGCSNNSSVTMTVGSDVLTFAVNTLLFSDYSWVANFDQAGDKWLKFDYDFTYRKDTWTQHVPNMSYYSSTASGSLSPILDAMCQPVSEPRYLSSLGAILAPGSSAYLLAFNTVTQQSFSALLTDIG